MAAQQEDTADAALGNITGSNAVNVFLGIGLPWSIAAIYWHFKYSSPFPASSIGFVEGVMVFSVCALICLASLVSHPTCHHHPALRVAGLAPPPRAPVLLPRSDCVS